MLLPSVGIPFSSFFIRFMRGRALMQHLWILNKRLLGRALLGLYVGCLLIALSKHSFDHHYLQALPESVLGFLFTLLGYSPFLVVWLSVLFSLDYLAFRPYVVRRQLFFALELLGCMALPLLALLPGSSSAYCLFYSCVAIPVSWTIYQKFFQLPSGGSS